MSTFFQLDEQRLRGLETMLADSMPLSTIERGWDYYRREKVLSVQVMDGTAIYGTVRGTEIYAVTLDTDILSLVHVHVLITGTVNIWLLFFILIMLMQVKVRMRFITGCSMAPNWFRSSRLQKPFRIRRNSRLLRALAGRNGAAAW